MIMFLLIGLAATAVSVALGARAAGFGARRRAAGVVAIDWYGYAAGGAANVKRQGSLLRPRLDDLAGRLGEHAARLGWLKEEDLRALLRSAGMYGSPRKFAGYRLLATGALPLVWLWLAHGGSPARLLLGLVLSVAFAWYGPLVWVRRKSRLRLEEIDYEMPELVDVLVTTIEAGVGFNSSLQTAARRLPGALGEELRLLVAEQEMGLATEAALANLAERVPTPSLRSFVRSVQQGETLGVSIGKIMRDLAEEMRKRRRQAAEERAQKAPTKMLFPLIFLIFPAMFVVLLGPAVVELMRSLKGFAG